MPFIKVEELSQMELFPKALSSLVSGDRIMLSFLEMEQGCVVPEHSHPHEQAGVVLEGVFRFRIGTEELVTRSGDAFIAAGGLQGALQQLRGDHQQDPLERAENRCLRVVIRC